MEMALPFSTRTANFDIIAVYNGLKVVKV